ncbi:CHRD domain-containing protein [Schleiferia thermophila]|jgi:hypothetical protein|uniref:Putative secreted protein (Por secretion system target) n=1 Tax=Schleiferia thermophila TaxID=884107 RepID=A0A369A5J5_9FLAO|nr:CHRD domain-containing protein [Schleiferia thermophila]KFD38963.1 hypothetical protein AT05_07360 [Schleiferia thermophila str. Yellowstone]PMB21320.1 T9SS C-terminal target domain-containing protein [Fischerella thermalis CCMEE 5319]RCX03678.1 putative secreted protein (Por secretion system target) [Schleiferia thermophila]GCD79912.1 hypothetical protein JCM30197_11590 [Schleiferia thermophila]
MKKQKLFSLAIGMLLNALNAVTGHLTEKLLMSAKLDGSQEVPAVSTNALGVAGILLNSTRDTACIDITVTGLSGPITGIHIHEGDPGMNGPVVIDLTPFVSGFRISTILTGMQLTQQTISKLLSGKYYINVHTAAHPAGEIRGQIYLETDWAFSTKLDGSQEVPPVMTPAYGVGFFNLSKDLSKITYQIVTQNLSGPITAAHLHYGAIGVNGGVAVDLTSNINGNVISGVINNPSQMLLDSLMSSKIYINVHTNMHPGGEIRGQLMNEKRYLYFDAIIDGMQEVPPVATNAKGVATVMLNTTLDTLWYDIVADGLSGPITSAHFHNAPMGSNGPVAVDLTSSIMGNRISGMVTGAALSNAFINQLLVGDIYINIHTAAHPSGEIRGQVYRVAREGYTISLDGMQEVPPVMTSAFGTGIVSIDRNQDNAHFMIVSHGLESNAIHFHKGVAGQNGPVIFDITPLWMNNGAFGFWKSSDQMPFTLQNSIQFRHDSVYVNVHTMAHPNGEIRGQVTRNSSCLSQTIGIDEEFFTEADAIKIYPNPAAEWLNVQIENTFDKNSFLSISDVTGKIVYSQQLPSGSAIVHKINVQNLNSGVYIIKVQTSNKAIQKKFVKK